LICIVSVKPLLNYKNFVTLHFNMLKMKILNNYLHYFLVFLFFIMSHASEAQTYDMSTTSVSACSGTFYDSGGSIGTYSDDEVNTMTFCSSSAGQQIRFNFTSFSSESYDHLIVYDGPNTSAPLLANYSGSSLSVPFTVTSSNGCLTFVFTSDGSVTYDGWTAAISCVTVPGYNMGNSGSISTCSGVFYDSGGTGVNYGNNENYTTSFCSGTAGQQIMFSFSSFNTENGSDILTVYDGPNNSSPVLGTFSGNTIPSGVVSSNGCLTFVFTSNGSVTGTGWSAAIKCVVPTTLCAVADAFCTGTTYNFPAGVNAGTAEIGPNYGCLGTQPNPAWYYLRIQSPGDISISMGNSAAVDIDFACLGPFSSNTTPCTAQLTATCTSCGSDNPQGTYSYPYGNLVDCSYNSAASEVCYIPNGVPGTFYILMITNFSNSPTNINFSQTGGTGGTDCSIVAPPITNNGPLCVGQTLNLIVANPVTGATYSWSGPNGFTSNAMNPTIPNVTLAAAGTYSLVITVGTQVSPAVTTTVVVNAAPVILVNNATICQGATATLTATGGATYLWNTGATTNPLLVTPSSNTTYTVTGTTAAGCSSTASAVVTINSNAPVSVNQPSICQGTSATLTANGAASYSWNTGSTSNPLVVSPTVTTTYTVTGTTTSGCTGTASAVVTVNLNPVITINQPSICQGNSATLTATGATTYLWNDGSSADPLTVTPSITSVYTVTGTNASGCTGTGTTTVTVSPSLSVTATNDTICKGETATILANGANTYLWNNGSITNPLNVSPQTTQSYQVTGTDANGCTGTSSTTVTVNPLPVVTTSSTNSYCSLNTGTATATGGITYLWSNGDTTATVSDLSSGAYTLTVSNGMCETIATVTVAEDPKVEASFTTYPKEMYLYDGDFIFTNTSNNAVMWLWTFGDGGGAETINASHAYNQIGIYNVLLYVEDAHGCSDTASTIVEVKDSPGLYIPNSFTPNGDGKNDVWQPVTYLYDPNEYQLWIFDRWGTKMFESSDITATWNGTLNNNGSKEDIIAGVYVYRILARAQKGKLMEYFGKITICR
jgi:gliding motility-associated-like protein